MNSSRRDRADRVGQRLARFERRGDVEDHQLVDALVVVAARERGGIPGVAQALELHAFDDAAVPDVEAGDQALGEHSGDEVPQHLDAGVPRTSRDGTARRTRRSVSTTDANGAAWVVVATASGVISAAYECVKYACVPGSMPASSREGLRISSEFQPTCGTFSVGGSRRHRPGDRRRGPALAGPLRCPRTATADRGRCRTAARRDRATRRMAARQSVVERGGRAEMADAGDDDAGRALEIAGEPRRVELGARRRESLSAPRSGCRRRSR